MISSTAPPTAHTQGCKYHSVVVVVVVGMDQTGSQWFLSFVDCLDCSCSSYMTLRIPGLDGG